MSDLTGEGSELYALTPEMAKNNEFWDKLCYFRDEAFLMGCAIEGVGEHDNGETHTVLATSARTKRPQTATTDSSSNKSNDDSIHTHTHAHA